MSNLRKDGKVFVVCHVVGNITDVQMVYFNEADAKKHVDRLKSRKGLGHHYIVESYVVDRNEEGV